MNKLSVYSIAAAGLLGMGLLLSMLFDDSNLERITPLPGEPIKYQTDVQVLMKTLMGGQEIPRVVLRDLFSDGASEAKLVNKDIQSNVSNRKKSTTTLTRPSVKISGPPVLMGVVIRKSGAKAFFVEKDKLFSVSRGDTLKGQYRIISIRDKQVDIRELHTGLTRTIFIKD